MNDKPTYKEQIIQYFENNKIFAGIILVLLVIVFAGKVISSLDSFGINNDRSEKRCDQIEKETSKIISEIKEVFQSSDNSINALKVKYSLNDYEKLLEEAGKRSCFLPIWRKEKLDDLKNIILSEIYFLIKERNERLIGQKIEEDLSWLCKEVIEYFDRIDNRVLSKNEKEILLKTIEIAENEH